MADGLSFERDGADWPHASASRFVDAGGLRWHVQMMGEGPVALLVHGTGASTHSWRGLAPLIAGDFRVVMIDLPGHGFSTMPANGSLSMSLPGMAHALARLLAELRLSPDLVVGHSAGAAILCRMAIDALIAPKAIISLNGALLPFRGAVSQFFSPLAKMLALNPLVPRLFAWSASGGGPVERLIRDTGSDIGREGIELYGRLFRNPGHVSAALAMMANWDLKPLEADFARLEPALVLVIGSNDRSISPDDAFRVKALARHGEVEMLRGLGHLAHEERPDLIAALIRRTAAKHLTPTGP
jgi:magnesium chelatase accessory protein